MPSKKVMARERAKLREMTATRLCYKPIPAIIRDLNRHLHGSANYFGYSGASYGNLARQVIQLVSWP